jgi:hypothetical protein
VGDVLPTVTGIVLVRDRCGANIVDVVVDEYRIEYVDLCV